MISNIIAVVVLIVLLHAVGNLTTDFWKTYKKTKKNYALGLVIFTECLYIFIVATIMHYGGPIIKLFV